MTTLLVNVAGLVLMGAIVWWFWLSGDDRSEQQTNHH